MFKVVDNVIVREKVDVTSEAPVKLLCNLHKHGSTVFQSSELLWPLVDTLVTPLQEQSCLNDGDLNLIEHWPFI